MSNQYRNYRVSVRASWWDYKNQGLYFITICTKNRQHYFGKISNGIMHLSSIGNIVQQEWLKTFEIRTDMNLTLSEFVVMPNHFHAIIGIGPNSFNTSRGTMHCALTCIEKNQNKFGPQSKNIASIIRGFKSSVTSKTRVLQVSFNWQRGFYDHIIRNEQAYENIAIYIQENPKNWPKDLFYRL
ncbi:MAG: hypothetical protein H7282_06070 [Cytophagaceae bacterium]|nr:hypothetical protein [Cytophagaceae bacterium]